MTKVTGDFISKLHLTFQPMWLVPLVMFASLPVEAPRWDKHLANKPRIQVLNTVPR